MSDWPQSYNLLAGVLRGINKTGRFDREKAMQPLYSEIGGYWSDGLDALFSFLAKHEGWEKIQRHVQMDLARASFTKALSDSDRKFFADLLVNFGFYGDAEKTARIIMEATSLDTFNAAAKFALEKIGIGDAQFDLRNDQIREKLLARVDAAVFATRNNIDSTLDTVIVNFYAFGRNPYNAEFVSQLREELSVKTDWQAKRFALTETGIASELAQVETYRRNGVTGKRWNITGVGTRESHADLSGESIDMDEKFDVGGSPADHPLDPSLPADELVNCHCWISPVVSDDFQIDPSRIWEGK